MNRSESIKELATALSKAQGAIKHAEKDGLNPHFKSSYATLASVLDAAKVPLASNGLCVSQHVQGGDNLVLETIVMHSSGEWISSTMPIILSRNDMQALGSTITYAKRYAYAAIVGIASGDDDDGEAAVGRSNQPYVVPFGKFKGKALSEIQGNEIAGYVQFLKQKAEQDGKGIQGVVAEFISRAEAHLQQVEVDVQ